MDLSPFRTQSLFAAMRQLFEDLKIPVSLVTEHPANPQEILQKTWRDGDEAFRLMQEVYFLGMVNEKAFSGEGKDKPLNEVRSEGKDYDGLLIFGVELMERQCGNLPTRSMLAEITRAFNREFCYTPVAVIFRYNDHTTISFAAAERLKYKQAWREGEKAWKVSLIKDIDLEKPHAGHVRIISSLSVGAIREYDRRNRVESFADLYKGWQKVLSTDVLNEQFYKDYQQLSRKLINKVYPEQIDNKLKAHQGILNLMNRLMFVSFIQKKGWLMSDPEFLYHYWQDYLQDHRPNDNFHKHWLNKLFFLAFNGNAFSDVGGELFKSLPKKYHETILEFPYLNGGLFTRTDEDKFLLSDTEFESIYNFLQGYIFTIDEDTAEDVSLEINPLLLGKMYEGMINATDLDDVDAEHGIVYTERPEINFMTRRSFVEVLDKKLPNKFSRDFLYHFCFYTSPERLELLKRYNTDVNLLQETILSVTALDPACGSGSMLLGLIQLMVELLKDLAAFARKPYSKRDLFQLKKHIISESIYGVDVKEWAVRIAELRFWLYMITEADFSTNELTRAPLLPNLDFKLRPGNSLIQEVGNIEFSLKGLFTNKKRNTGAAGKLNRFINKKKQFVCNQGEADTSFIKLKEEELSVFKEFLKDHMFENNRKISQYTRGDGQQTIFGDEKKNLFEDEINELEKENEELQRILNSMRATKRLPFSFDIDFMEVFLTSDDPGFDLVIGNPPYVRQEDILPADNALELERLLKPENKDEKRRISAEYKIKLSDKVYRTYPFLKLKASTVIEGQYRTVDLYGKKVPGRSDLYVYFQLLCPALLNSKGTFCFIISNSWLDVEYGGFVQQFLLKHTRLHAIYDCTVRSFTASVNTIIYLHSAIRNTKLSDAAFKRLTPPDEPVRFVMNKADYTDTSYAPLLVEQQHCTTNTFRDHYRVIVKTQKELWDEGFDEETMQYQSNKWGGKYLRAPEIFYTILEKGKGKLYPLKKYAHVGSVAWSRKGFNSELIFRTKDLIDKIDEYLPLLKSPKDVTQIAIGHEDTSHSLLLRPDISDSIVYADLLWVDLRNDKHSCHLCIEPIAFTHNFHGLISKTDHTEQLCAYLNSSLSCFFIEVLGRGNLGEGAIRILANDLEKIFPVLAIPDIIDVSSFFYRKQNGVLTEFGFDRRLPIRDQDPNPLPDRKELDDIIFNALGLTEEERKEVYWVTAELVKQRLDKAGSR
jgi:hypothetical protein